MKNSKHLKPKEPKKEKISANRFDQPLATFVYEDTEKQPRLSVEETVKIPKAVYRVGLILAVAVLLLAIWMNREHLKPQSIKNWFSHQLKGEEIAEGFPVSILGNKVEKGNFKLSLGNAAVLSDTALTVLDTKGSQASYTRHSFANPILKEKGGYHLIYNSGLEGYLLSFGEDILQEKQAEKKIYFADVARNGTFLLGMRGTEYASEIQVIKKDGKIPFKYSFASGYANAAALNATASMGAVNTLDSAAGELFSKITIHDFGKKDPLFEYELKGNMIIDLFWADSGKVLAIGDQGAAVVSSKQSEKEEYSYEGEQLTAYCASSSQLYIGLSGHEYGGSGRILVMGESAQEPQTLELSKRALSLSVYGGTLAVLTDSEILFYDSGTLQEIGAIRADSDAKAIVLENESSVYVLGASEVRKVNLK